MCACIYWGSESEQIWWHWVIESIGFAGQNVSTNFLRPYMESLGSTFSNGANFAVVGSSTLPRYVPFALNVQIMQFLHFKARSLELVTAGKLFFFFCWSSSSTGILSLLVSLSNWFWKNWYCNKWSINKVTIKNLMVHMDCTKHIAYGLKSPSCFISLEAYIRCRTSILSPCSSCSSIYVYMLTVGPYSYILLPYMFSYTCYNVLYYYRYCKSWIWSWPALPYLL